MTVVDMTVKVPRIVPTPRWDEWMQCPRCNALGHLSVTVYQSSRGTSTELDRVRVECHLECPACGHETEKRSTLAF